MQEAMHLYLYYLVVCRSCVLLFLICFAVNTQGHADIRRYAANLVLTCICMHFPVRFVSLRPDKVLRRAAKSLTHDMSTHALMSYAVLRRQGFVLRGVLRRIFLDT